MVSFGVLPGLILFTAFNPEDALHGNNATYLAILVPLFAAYRLAIFHNDESQKTHFRGLPVPANALFIASMVYIHQFKTGSFLYFDSRSLLYLCLGTSILQVIMIRFESLKFEGTGFRKNFIRYGLILSSAVLIVALRMEGLSLSVLLYIAVSIALAESNKNNTPPEAAEQE